MRKTFIYSFIIAICCCCTILASIAINLSINKLQVQIVTKQTANGKLTTVEADMYYQSNGDITTHFQKPAEYILQTNKEGEYQVYDPKANTIEQDQSESVSTEITFFSYFLNGQVNDMGLRKMGFQQIATDFNDGLLVTEWQPKSPLGVPIFKAELVHQDYKPVYLGYENFEGKALRKMFFYNYKKIGAIDFPTTITEINFYENGDSSISKTQYKNIKINEAASGDYFDFQPPSDAKLK
ncbi:MAG: hypothetical protein ACPG5B_11425 [Chitinophagales bacterium]